uniref:Uncharacterized protein n=1 Tax=Anguilla anguilla TaxID=7936 RepID=A0A0E9QSA6_ANGAN
MLRTTELDDMNTPYRHTVKSRARAHTHTPTANDRFWSMNVSSL